LVLEGWKDIAIRKARMEGDEKNAVMDSGGTKQALQEN